MKIYSLLVACLVALATTSVVQAQFVEQIVFGANNYTEFRTGSVNIIISTPHDGTQQPTSISNRTNDSLGNLLRDTNTYAMAVEIRNKLKELFSVPNTVRVPFLVANRLHRIKMDPNRDGSLCCENIAQASYTAYNEYHTFIRQNFTQNFVVANSLSRALLIDIHGQAHTEQRVELGYLFSASHLNTTTTLTDRRRSSVCKLAERSNYTLNELIRGSVSLGALLMQKFTSVNGTAIPSPSYTKPFLEDYYSGGYIIQEHGSRYCNRTNVDAIQLELPSYMRTSADHLTYARSIAEVIYQFYNLHYA